MRQQKQGGVNVFISYAHADQKMCDRLTIHLSQLQRDGQIEAWSDQQISAGASRAQEIGQAIRRSHIILLLISADFLASDAHYLAEMQQALERHERGEARVIPIIVRPCDWLNSPFAHLQYLPRNTRPISTWKNQDKAFLSVVQELRQIIAQQQFPMPPLYSLVRSRLLKQVRATWIELLEHSLHRAAWIDLHLQEQPDALGNPWCFEVQELEREPQPLPVGTSIVQVYDEANGKLLILGEPGSGKTTLLLHLAQTLLDRAEIDEHLPIPVVFNLSSWAQKKEALDIWLVEELWTKYQVPRKVGQRWIAANQVLLLLDGLDEVEKKARRACIQQIAKYYLDRLNRESSLECGSISIVICCRSQEYNTLSTRIGLQRAVGIQPLTDEQITTYLRQAGKQIKGMKQAIEEDVELRSLVGQPLMLNVFVNAYQGAMRAEVPTGKTREELRYIVFTAYINRMLKRRGKLKRWEQEQMIRYLIFLAQLIQRNDQTVFSIENLLEKPQIWLASRWRSKGQAFGQKVRYAIEPFAGKGVGMVIEWIVGYAFGLVGAVLFGPIGGLIGGLESMIKRAEKLDWSWKEARFYWSIGGLFGGRVVRWVVILLFMLIARRVVGLNVILVVLISGPVLALIVGLLGGFFSSLTGRELPEHLSLFPNEGIWRSAKNGLIFGFLAGLAVGVIAGSLAGPLVGLVVGVIVGVGIGLIAGLGALAKHFLFRFFHSLRGRLPWRLKTFLDEAAERILLRKVGDSYIFIHRLLLEHFAALDEPTLSDSTGSEGKAEKYDADV